MIAMIPTILFALMGAAFTITGAIWGLRVIFLPRYGDKIWDPILGFCLGALLFGLGFRGDPSKWPLHLAVYVTAFFVAYLVYLAHLSRKYHGTSDRHPNQKKHMRIFIGLTVAHGVMVWVFFSIFPPSSLR